MIFDTMDRIALYEGVLPYAAEIAAAWQAKDPAALPFEVRHKQYDTRADAARRFEVHAHTIDLMVCLSGREVIHICPESELTPAEFLPNGADGRKLDGGPRGSAVLLMPGTFAAILPGEAHMVAGRVNVEAEPLEKWVMKVPAADKLCVESI